MVFEVVAGEAVEVVQADFFCLFGAWLFEEDDACESDYRGGGWAGCASVAEVLIGMGMSVAGGGAGSRGDLVVSKGDVGVGGWGAEQRDCCRFPEIFGEPWEDLPYLSLPFLFDFDNAFL